MAGSKFQYDESGGTFFYFLLSFLALVLIPGTYYFWPRKEKKDDKSILSKQCQCERCQIKRSNMNVQEPSRRIKQRTVKILIIIGWIAFVATAYKVAHLEHDYINWDPFEILGIDKGASQAEIKKAYRKLSLIYHPDKDTGDEKKFLQLTKAHAALTDQDAKKNWEMYGNPDGPGAMSFGIALPSWIVEKENSVWVLGLYACVFMVALPTVVGAWWYRSIKYGGDQVLLNTMKLYYHFIDKTPNMSLNRALMVLAASFEFEKGHNSEIVERPSDNVELPALMPELPDLKLKNKEFPLCAVHSIKSRALLHAHLSRLELPPKTLELDKNYVVKKCPYLIHEMVQCVAQLFTLAYAGRTTRMPNLETIENVMKLSPMIVQALWDKKSPLLQLPHITEDMLRHFVTRKRNIRSIRQLIGLKSEDRRSLLRGLSDEQYINVMQVCSQMPYLEMDVKSEVLDDEDVGTITTGSIVTVTVTLMRKNLETIFEQETNEIEVAPAVSEKDEDEATVQNKAPVKKPVWQKQKRKGKGAPKPKKKLPPSKPQPAKKPVQNDIKADASPIAEKVTEERSDQIKPKNAVKDETNDESGSSDNEGGGSDSDSESHESKEGNVRANEDDDEEWDKFQVNIPNKEKILETKSKKSHSVHCPYFPEDKQEYWWVYVADRKHRVLITAPYQVTNLVDQVEAQLKFSAPPKRGMYQYTVVIKSDSYLDLTLTRNIKLDVKEAKAMDLSHPQWDISEDEKEEMDDISGESDAITDDDSFSDHD